MRYRIRDLPQLVRTPLGRRQLFHGLSMRTAPLVMAWAGVYRRAVIHRTTITAVIGSFGKTTTTRCLLAGLGLTVHDKLEGNSGISLARNMLCIRPSDTRAVLEVGISRPGQMARNQALVRPDSVVVTSIGSEHNRSMGTLEVTRKEKAVMVKGLGGDGLAVLNGDDPNVRWMKDQTRARVITFGLGEANDFQARDVRLNWPVGTSFSLHYKGGTIDVLSPFLGRHMIYPVLAAAAVAWDQGLDLNDCMARIAGLEPTRGRMQPVRLDSGAIVVRDDYKSAPETIHAALDFLETIPASRRIVVLGEVNEPPGNQNPVYRTVGERIGQVADRAFFVCTRKSFQSYSSGAVSCGMAREDLFNAGHDGLPDLVARLGSEIGPGDVLLVKGRSSQRLERITFALQGRRIACHLGFCDAKSTSCMHCPMLERGWEGRTIVF